MSSVAAQDWNGLADMQPTLPSASYFSPEQFDQDLSKIWYRNWVYLCRSAVLEEPLAFRTFEIGTQQILLLRDEAGVLRAFHNTCRHRGSTLCPSSEGSLRSKYLTCPYHSWTYNLQGELLRTPPLARTAEFDLSALPLYGIKLAEWNGFVFVNLDESDPLPFERTLDAAPDRLNNWPIADLVVGHSFSKIMRCNWKIFWENYNECLHCPQVHPELCKIVPIYGRRIMERRDDPEWRDRADEADPRYAGGLKQGAETWSMDGTGHGYRFAGLTDAERREGYVFVTSLPSMYVVAHVDYVRVVRLRPVGPELTELTAEWLFPPEAIADKSVDLANIVEFATLVMQQDTQVCELNQSGLKSIRHDQGALMPEEYAVHQFHNWVRAEWARG
jgi:Rieske 2Fe-2S family protein